MGQPAMFYTMGSGRPCPFVAVHGMPTLKPSKAKQGIFKAVVRRYIFFGMVTLAKI
jgi:hypothetical protein